MSLERRDPDSGQRTKSSITQTVKDYQKRPTIRGSGLKVLRTILNCVDRLSGGQVRKQYIIGSHFGSYNYETVGQ